MLKHVVAELCNDIQVVIPEIAKRMGNYNQEVSDSVVELFSGLVIHCRCHYCSLIDMLNYISQLTSAMQCK